MMIEQNVNDCIVDDDDDVQFTLHSFCLRSFKFFVVGLFCKPFHLLCLIFTHTSNPYRHRSLSLLRFNPGFSVPSFDPHHNI